MHQNTAKTIAQQGSFTTCLKSHTERLDRIALPVKKKAGKMNPLTKNKQCDAAAIIGTKDA